MADTQKSKGKRMFTLPVFAAVVLLMALALLLMPQGKKTGSLSPGDSLTIPLASVTRTASFYPVKVDGTEMEVLAIRTEGGEIRTAFNTCQTCYDSDKGYYAAEGEELVCQNCGFRFTEDRVGVAGDRRDVPDSMTFVPAIMKRMASGITSRTNIHRQKTRRMVL